MTESVVNYILLIPSGKSKDDNRGSKVNENTNLPIVHDEVGENKLMKVEPERRELRGRGLVWIMISRSRLSMTSIE